MASHHRDAKLASAIAEEFPDLQCVVCLELYTDPISLMCGHTLCRLCLSRLLGPDGVRPRQEPTCPSCRRKIHLHLPDTSINVSMKGAINAVIKLKEEQAALLEENKALLAAAYVGARLAAAASSAAAPAPTQVPLPLTQSPLLWQCGVCTLMNEAGESACAACSTPRPEGDGEQAGRRRQNRKRAGSVDNEEEEEKGSDWEDAAGRHQRRQQHEPEATAYAAAAELGAGAGAGAGAADGSPRAAGEPRYTGTVTMVKLAIPRPHGFIAVDRAAEPWLFDRLLETQQSTNPRAKTASLSFQVRDLEDEYGGPVYDGLLAMKHMTEARVTFEVAMRADKCFARHVRPVD